MPDPLVSIILRSYNEAWALRDTLTALRAQEYRDWELIVIDSGSTDGSVELIRDARPRHFIQIQPAEYNPSRVLNQGMALARADFGIFINADATPQGSGWLRPLVEALQDPQTAAVFGRQVPRPDCRAVYAHDYERCFGANRESAHWDHFFSMASSGLRKDVWARRGFLEKLQYSEDDEYTRWCRAQGYRVAYVRESIAMHSHNYTAAQAYKRSFGEARALAAVWNRDPGEINFARTVLLGWLNDARRDLGFCARTGRLSEWPHALGIRWQQRRARLAGFREGWRIYRGGDRETGSSAFRQHFTLDGGHALENHLGRVCDQVLSGVRASIPASRLEALVLGGGYGRGQGGVLQTAAGERPYNDLEFYVFVRGNRLWNERRYGEALRRLGERCAALAGVHVEFKVDSLRHLRRSPVTMFSYDLVSRHAVLWPADAGTALRVFDGCEHHLDAGGIPLSEATRLLFNRCTGLLLAKELLARPGLTLEQTDFVERNLAKAKLAFGDVILCVFGKYHWSCLERHRRLSDMAGSGSGMSARFDPLAGEVRTICQHHADGVQFKLQPHLSAKSAEQLRVEHREISNLARRLWLWLENRRLNGQFASARDYAFSGIAKCSDTAAWRNLVLNVKTFGPASLFDGRSVRYPRERLLNSLVLLLWEDASINAVEVKRYLQDQLQTATPDWPDLVSAYKRVWPAFG